MSNEYNEEAAYWELYEAGGLKEIIKKACRNINANLKTEREKHDK